MITVFTSCHNQAKHLSYAIESVLRQNYCDFEYLIYDDGSTDKTWEIIQYFARRDKRIKPIQLKKQANVGVVINLSIKKAKGKHWVWCPADDMLYSKLLETKQHWSNGNKDWVLYDNWTLIDEFGIEMGEHIVKPMTPEEFNKEVWFSSPIGFTGIWIPVNVLRTLPFPEHLNYSEDFYWMIKATLHGIKFFGLPQKLHYKRKHPNTTTSKNIKAILKQIPVIRKELKSECR